MDQQTLIVVGVVVAALVLVGIVVLVMRRRRNRRQREALEQRYGSEYRRTVEATGSQKAAAAELEDRERRHESLELQDLSVDDVRDVRSHLAALQYRFVDDPSEALLGMNRVLTEVLRNRGYPIVEDREEGLRQFGLDHPEAAQDVRAVLQGDYGPDTGRMRDLFVGARRALRASVGISYELEDALRDEAAPRERTDGPPKTTPETRQDDDSR